MKIWGTKGLTGDLEGLRSEMIAKQTQKPQTNGTLAMVPTRVKSACCSVVRCKRWISEPPRYILVMMTSYCLARNFAFDGFPLMINERSLEHLAVPALSPRWSLQQAKARLSELVRKVQGEGPQHITLHGKEAVVVIDEATYRRLTLPPSGRSLVEALQACPDPSIELAPDRAMPMPVRDVTL